MKLMVKNYTEDGRVHLTGYLWEQDILFRGKRKRPAVLICPGGAYKYCAVREMDPVALAFAAKGYHTFILSYSVGDYAAGFRPMEEVDRAIGTIREHAEQWGIIADQVIIVGFSAGGHLALAGGLRTKHRANAMILGYPVTDTGLLDGLESTKDPLIRALIGENQVTAERLGEIDMLRYVSKDAPPLFLFNTFKDEILVREHCLRLVSQYSKLGVPCEYHLYQEGAHGLSLANEVTAGGSPQMEVPQVSGWFELAAEWLKDILKSKEEER